MKLAAARTRGRTHDIVDKFWRLVGVLGLGFPLWYADRFVGILHELVESLPSYVCRQRRIVLLFVVLVPGGFWKGRVRIVARGLEGRGLVQLVGLVLLRVLVLEQVEPVLLLSPAL